MKLKSVFELFFEMAKDGKGFEATYSDIRAFIPERYQALFDFPIQFDDTPRQMFVTNNAVNVKAAADNSGSNWGCLVLKVKYD